MELMHTTEEQTSTAANQTKVPSFGFRMVFIVIRNNTVMLCTVK